nr:diguanylate cyclase [Texcoconibacillus texcoconensis]
MVDTVPMTTSVERLFTSVVQQEAAVHGYLATGDTEHLKDYDEEKQNIFSILEDLETYEEEYPNLYYMIEERAKPKISQLQRYYETQTAYMKIGFVDEAQGMIEQTKRVLDDIRSLNDEMVQMVEVVMDASWDDLQDASSIARSIILTNAVVALGIVGVFVYFYRIGRQNQKLRKMTNTDRLTGVYNRRYFDWYIHEKWDELSGKEPLSIVLFDIDNYKEFNDTFGHQKGDDCLKHVAKKLTLQMQGSQEGILARYGGEEFIAVLPKYDKESAMQFAERSRLAIEGMKIVHDTSETSPFVTISSGVSSVIPSEEKSIRTFLYQADSALYDAKERGKNREEYQKY